LLNLAKLAIVKLCALALLEGSGASRTISPPLTTRLTHVLHHRRTRSLFPQGCWIEPKHTMSLRRALPSSLVDPYEMAPSPPRTIDPADLGPQNAHAGRGTRTRKMRAVLANTPGVTPVWLALTGQRGLAQPASTAAGISMPPSSSTCCAEHAY